MGIAINCKFTIIDVLKIKMLEGIARTLGNAKHIPELKKKLIPLGILDSLGYSLPVKGDLKKIANNSRYGEWRDSEKFP